jgi:hypothetical protein
MELKLNVIIFIMKADMWQILEHTKVYKFDLKHVSLLCTLN